MTYEAEFCIQMIPHESKLISGNRFPEDTLANLKSRKCWTSKSDTYEKKFSLWDKVAFFLTSIWLIYVPTDIFYISDKYPILSLGLNQEIPLAIVQSILGWIFLIIAPWGLIMLGSIFVWHALMPKIPERAKRFKNES